MPSTVKDSNTTCVESRTSLVNGPQSLPMASNPTNRQEHQEQLAQHQENVGVKLSDMIWFLVILAVSILGLTWAWLVAS